MTKKQQHSVVEDEFEEVGKALGSAETFVENNKNYVLYAIVFVILIIGATYYYNNNKATQEKEAQTQLFASEQQFAQDSLRLALGGGDNVGFLNIAENYGGTPSGNLAKAYAGVTLLRLGEYERAIKYLKEFDGDDALVTPALLGAIGDAYLEQKDFSNAETYYKKACKSNVDIVTPFFMAKQGIALEGEKKYADAIAVYDQLVEKYPRSMEAMQVQVNKTRAQVLLQSSAK